MINFRPDKKPNMCEKCGSIFKLQIALKTHNCAGVQKRKQLNDCSVVLEDCLKGERKRRGKAAAPKSRSSPAVSAATGGNSFFDDSINSAQRENDDEGDVDDPEAIVSEESEDSDEEVAAVQKSKKKRKNKSYGDEVWVIGFLPIDSHLYCMTESLSRIFSRVTVILAMRARRLPSPRRQRSREKITRLS